MEKKRIESGTAEREIQKKIKRPLGHRSPYPRGISEHEAKKRVREGTEVRDRDMCATCKD